jgi:ABC-type transport system involved in multi-copper enzyme maturation permease subunit
MMDYTEDKSKFWVFFLLLLIIAPFVIMLTPMIVAVTLSDTPDKVVFIPKGTSMMMYGLAFAVVIVFLCAMYFSKSKLLNMLLGFIAVVGFITIFSLGAQNYVYLHKDFIKNNPILGSKVEYQWEDLAKVTHEMYDEKTNREETYIFEFKDGYTFSFIGSGIVDGKVKSEIYQKVIKLEVPYDEY